MDCNSLFCESCFLAKSHRSVYKIKPYLALKPFYLIHSDVWGPSKIATLTRKKWFVTFIDDHTRLCWLYLMIQKMRLQDSLKFFTLWLKTNFKLK